MWQVCGIVMQRMHVMRNSAKRLIAELETVLGLSIRSGEKHYRNYIGLYGDLRLLHENGPHMTKEEILRMMEFILNTRKS